MTLDMLRDEVREAAEHRGHELGEFDKEGVAVCSRCGAVAFVDVNPGPRGIRAGGRATFVFCTDVDRPRAFSCGSQRILSVTSARSKKRLAMCRLVHNEGRTHDYCANRNERRDAGFADRRAVGRDQARKQERTVIDGLNR